MKIESSTNKHYYVILLEKEAGKYEVSISNAGEILKSENIDTEDSDEDEDWE